MGVLTWTCAMLGLSLCAMLADLYVWYFEVVSAGFNQDPLLLLERGAGLSAFTVSLRSCLLQCC